MKKKALTAVAGGRVEENQNSPTMSPLTRPRRIAYNSVGVLLIGLGVVGIITPVLPTTIFFILASGLLIRSNPALHRWLHRNKITGPFLHAYTEGRGLSRRRKVSTIVVLWVGMGISIWFVRNIVWLVVLLAAIGVAITIHVATIRPRKRHVDSVAGESDN